MTDTKTMVHVGAEAVIVGGLALWTHKRLGDIEAKLESLGERSRALEEAVRTQGSFVASHENAFRHSVPAQQVTKTFRQEDSEIEGGERVKKD